MINVKSLLKKFFSLNTFYLIMVVVGIRFVIHYCLDLFVREYGTYPTNDGVAIVIALLLFMYLSAEQDYFRVKLLNETLYNIKNKEE